MFNTELDHSERMFVAIAFLPKAAVQAALVSQIYDTVNDSGETGPMLDWAKQSMTILVMEIVITSPLISVLSSIGGR